MMLLAAALVVAPPAQVISASGGWAALDRGTSCEAVARSLRTVPKGEERAIAGLAFGTGGRPWAQFSVRLGRPLRAGSSVIVDIGSQTFLLAARGMGAWSRDSAQDQAIIAALRSAPAMRLSARDQSGRRIRERFDTRGAATAIDAAAARCAGKSR